MPVLFLVAFCLALSGLCLAAESGPPVRIWKGKLLEWDRGAGEYSLRGVDFRVERCRFDNGLWVERDRGRIPIEAVESGLWVEVVVDLSEGPARCRTLTLYVPPQPEPDAARTKLRLRLPTTQGFLDNLWPRGNLTFAGIVSQLSPDQLVLRTRGLGPRTFLLRSDTTFTAEGRSVSSAQLQPQMQVYVRAGRTLDGDLEAFQVIWGQIVKAR